MAFVRLIIDVRTKLGIFTTESGMNRLPCLARLHFETNFGIQIAKLHEESCFKTQKLVGQSYVLFTI